MWLSRRLSSKVTTGWSLARFGSVSTSARFTFNSARSMPTSRVTPRPKRMAEAASSKAYSEAMDGFYQLLVVRASPSRRLPMDAERLKSMQGPLKDRYRAEPSSARITLRAAGRATEGIACKLETGKGMVEAGLHPATGGTGAQACSGDMLLEALVACAGVTLRAVATAIGVELRDARVTAEGDLDFRGTLGVSKEAKVGFERIRLRFDLDSDASEEQRATLLKLTERYCVVLQTLRAPPALSVEMGPLT